MKYENLKESIIDIVKNRIIYKEDKKYSEIRKNKKLLEEFFREKFNYDLIIEHELLKLERMSDQTNQIYGIDEFNKKEQYIIFLLILDYLEEIESGRTVLISDLIAHVTDNYPEECDWKKYHLNLSLIKALRYCTNMKMLKILDGSEQDYLDNIGAEVEVLYENTGNSKYFMRQLPIVTEDLNSWTDYIDLDKDKNEKRKSSFARRALINNTIINSDEEVYGYILENRENLENEFEIYLNSRIIITESFAYLLTDKNERLFSQVFPDTKNITTVALLLCNEIKNENRLKFNEEELLYFVQKVMEDRTSAISNENRRKEPSELLEDILKLLESLNIVKNQNEIYFSEFIYHIEMGLNGEEIKDE